MTQLNESELEAVSGGGIYLPGDIDLSVPDDLGPYDGDSCEP